MFPAPIRPIEKTWSFRAKNTSFWGKRSQAIPPKKRSYELAARYQAVNPVIAHSRTGVTCADEILRMAEITVPGSPERP